MQETKRSSFYQFYISEFCPRQINKFEYSNADGASGGLITLWNGSLFTGVTTLVNFSSITVMLTSLLTGRSFHISNIYGPCAADEKSAFISWLYNFDTDSIDDWLLAGDFNLMRSLGDRNKPGGNINDMLLFNDVLQHLILVEIPFQGRTYSWSNMEMDPLLEKYLGLLAILSPKVY